MRSAALRLLLPLTLLLAACAFSAPDDALVVDLRAAVATTLDAMAVPPGERPSPRGLEDQVRLLAQRSQPERVAEIRAGSYAAPELRRDCARLDQAFDDRRRAAAYGGHLEPPRMYLWLRERIDTLDLRQRLLLHALMRQVERESGM